MKKLLDKVMAYFGYYPQKKLKTIVKEVANPVVKKPTVKKATTRKVATKKQ